MKHGSMQQRASISVGGTISSSRNWDRTHRVKRTSRPLLRGIQFLEEKSSLCPREGVEQTALNGRGPGGSLSCYEINDACPVCSSRPEELDKM